MLILKESGFDISNKLNYVYANSKTCLYNTLLRVLCTVPLRRAVIFITILIE
jgi:hypothetical protein